jgi:hypothetical protein
MWKIARSPRCSTCSNIGRSTESWVAGKSAWQDYQRSLRDVIAGLAE